MDAAVLVPGIMATRLVLPAAAGGEDEEVWPPTPLETRFGYGRIDRLQDPRVVAGGLVDSVLCFPFYVILSRLLRGVGYRESGPKRLVEFPYDWRRDNFDTADALADRLDVLVAEGVERIALIGHSMGGLVCRLLLESGRYDGRPFLGRVTLFAALATPHLGAPLALARIFGVDATLGLSGADFAALAANPAFPSGYQLIPAPGEKVVWDMSSPDLATLDVYDPAVATRLGMNPALVARAAALHAALNPDNAPAHVRYVYFAGAGHETVTRVNVAAAGAGAVDHAMTAVTRTADAGDGTVPLYSALPHRGQRQIVVNAHATVFDGEPFRRAFFRLFGVDAGPALEAAVEPAPVLSLSLSAPVQPAGRPLAVTMSVQTSGAGARDGEPGAARVGVIRGALRLERLDEAGEAVVGTARETPLVYEGPPVPGLSLRLDPVEAPGLYRLRFEGTPEAPRPAPFAVSGAGR